MKGLEIAKRYYSEYGEKMLEEKFGEFFDKITVGLAGSGSECLGYDDELSLDHDLELGFCLWIDEESEREFGFKLERAYAGLPSEFQGLKRGIMVPAGGKRRGVIVSEEFCERFLGTTRPPIKNTEWLRIPSYSLAEFTSGEIFKPGREKYFETREIVLRGYPTEVRKKKISVSLALMYQAGIYNYERCLKHNERGAAQLAIFEFVDRAIDAVYLLNNAYRPFYKWTYRRMKELPVLSELSDSLIFLTESGNTPKEAEYKRGIIDDISRSVIEKVRQQNLAERISDRLDENAFFIIDTIKDPELKQMHIMDDGR